MLTAMSAIGSVPAGNSALELRRASGAAQSGAGQADSGGIPFSDLLGDAMGEASKLDNEAQKAVAGLLTGSGVDVHQAMIATEKASIAFELSLAVRNKAVQAYQQVMSMQF